MGTRRRAAGAEIRAAAFTKVDAAFTNVGFAPPAVIDAVFIERASAITAVTSAPSVEFDVGVSRRISPENLLHDHEEVIEPSIGQGLGNRRIAVSGAQPLVLHMGMCHGGLGRRRIGIAGDNPILLADVIERGPIEANLKPSQLDVLKHDGLGGDKQLRRTPVAVDLAELGFEGDQVTVEVTGIG